jgi:hypothetical protein
MQCPHERDVFAVAMVVIAGDVGVGAVLDAAASVGKTIPDGFTLAVFVPGAFDLIGGSRCAPVEAVRKRDRRGRDAFRSAGKQRRCSGCGQGLQELATSRQGI